MPDLPFLDGNPTIPNPQTNLGTRHRLELWHPLSLIRKFPADSLAISDEHTKVSYGVLNAATRTLSTRLFDAKVQKGDLIAIVAPRSKDLIIAIASVLLAQARFLIIDDSLPDVRVHSLITTARAKWILPIGTTNEGRLQKTNSSNQHVLRIFEDIYKPQNEQALENEISQQWISQEAIAVSGYCLFTSGTTGSPKPVSTDLAPLCHFIDWHRSTFKFNPSDRFSLLSGLAHDPILRDLFSPLSTGASIHIPPKAFNKSPEVLLDWLHKEKITVMHLTPQLGRLICHENTRRTKWGLKPIHLDSLRLCFFGGDSLFARDIKQWTETAPHCQCVNFYGTTETPQAVSYHIIDKDCLKTLDPCEKIPIGRAIDSTQILILNNHNELAAPRKEGIIHIRSPFLSTPTQEPNSGKPNGFQHNPFNKEDPADIIYNTGDAGYYREDGVVCCNGRTDDQVKINGHRVDPSEVAAIIASLPTIGNTYVLPTHAMKTGVWELAAFVTTNFLESCEACPSRPTPLSIRERLLQILPDYMVPSKIFIEDSIPLNSNGKVDRAVLQSRLSKQETVRDESLDGELRTKIAACWSQNLGYANPDPAIDFENAGGNSLLALSLASDLESVLGRPISSSIIYTHRTINSLVAHLSSNEKQASMEDIPEAHKAPNSEYSNANLILDTLAKKVEKWKNAEGMPPRQSKTAYSMRSSPAVSLLAKTLYATGKNPLQHIADYLLLRYEGGAWYTKSLRKLYKQYHDMTIGDYSSFCFDYHNFKPGTTFGRYCDVTRTARFETANHPIERISSHAVFYHKSLGFSSGVKIPRKRIAVGNDVHIGHNAVVLYPTECIGDGAIIAANAVVTTNVPPYAIVAGYPAKVIHYRFPDPIIKQLQALNWWTLPLEELKDVKHLFETSLTK